MSVPFRADPDCPRAEDRIRLITYRIIEKTHNNGADMPNANTLVGAGTGSPSNPTWTIALRRFPTTQGRVILGVSDAGATAATS